MKETRYTGRESREGTCEPEFGCVSLFFPPFFFCQGLCKRLENTSSLQPSSSLRRGSREHHCVYAYRIRERKLSMQHILFFRRHLFRHSRCHRCNEQFSVTVSWRPIFYTYCLLVNILFECLDQYDMSMRAIIFRSSVEPVTLENNHKSSLITSNQ